MRLYSNPMAERKLHRARVDVRPRFRCLVCRRFVEGTEHGTCPRCGWEPPQVAPETAPPRGMRLALMVALLVGLLLLLGWIR
jgi:hypothetical protein